MLSHKERKLTKIFGKRILLKKLEREGKSPKEIWWGCNLFETMSFKEFFHLWYLPIEHNFLEKTEDSLMELAE